MKHILSIFTVITTCLQISFLSADWEISITGHDVSSIGSEDDIILGMCENCQDGWDFVEDEYNLSYNGNTPFTDINNSPHLIEGEVVWEGDIPTNNRIQSLNNPLLLSILFRNITKNTPHPRIT